MIMKVILSEMKKIFTLKMICILLFVSTIIYSILVISNLDCNNFIHFNDYNIMVKLIRDNGNTMNEKSVSELTDMYKDNMDKANELISSNSAFKKMNIKSFADYHEAEKAAESGKSKIDPMESVEKHEMEQYCKTWSISSMLIDYNNRDNYSLSGSQGERLKEISAHRENESIFSHDIIEHYDCTISSLGICIIVGVSVMLLPMFLKDRLSGVRSVQYTSREGRKLYKRKIAAGVLSTVIITTVELVIFFSMYRVNNVDAFLSSNLNSAFNKSKLWISITFRGYIILTIVCIYALSIITALITMFISVKSNGYIVGIAIELLFVYTICFMTSVQIQPFLFFYKLKPGVLLNNLFTLNSSKYLVPGMYLVLIAVSAGLTVFMAKWEKKRDVLE